MMDGRCQLALEAAKSACDLIRRDAEPFEDEWRYIEPFLTLELHVLVRFGRWQEILSYTTPRVLVPRQSEHPFYPYLSTKATAHYAKGVAYAASGKVEQAKAHAKELKSMLSDEDLQTFKLFNNWMARPDSKEEKEHGILNVAYYVLLGEIAYREAVMSKPGVDKSMLEKAYGYLSKAVELDDRLAYDEPWGWMMPSRHALGALLLEQHRYKEAEQILLEDLGQRMPSHWEAKRDGIFYNKHPNNMWALRGLHRVYKCLGMKDEMHKAYERFRTASVRSDTRDFRTCYCARGGDL